MNLSASDVWGHFAPMFHLVDVFAIYAITLVSATDSVVSCVRAWGSASQPVSAGQCHVTAPGTQTAVLTPSCPVSIPHRWAAAT